MGLSDLPLPWFTNLGWIFAIFVAALAVCHALFLYVMPLGSIGWKRVDYVWLSMALLGILGAVGSGRELIARNLLESAHQRLASGYQLAQKDASFGTSVAICREFVQSPYSPPPEAMDKLQKDYDAQCAWFKKAVESLRSIQPGDGRTINFDQLFGPIPEGGDREVYKWFRSSVAGYNASVQNLQDLEAEAKPTEYETVVRLLGPALLAIALALRMTKVTGEIRAERARAKS